MRSCLYRGEVIHQRLQPKQHRFAYRVTAWLVDLDELPQLDKKLFGFGHNRFNLIAFHDTDYGGGVDGRNSDNNVENSSLTQLKEYLHTSLEKDGIQTPRRISLLCYPRYLGYVFKPLSTYFCYDQQDNVSAIIYEVSNTFGGRHHYVIKVADAANQTLGDNEQTRTIQQAAKKCFYVSPFNPELGQYEFTISPPENHVAIVIKQSDQQQNLLHASFQGEQVELHALTALHEFIKTPFMTIKILLAIHWEATRLWLKGLRLYPRPTIKKAFVTSSQPLKKSKKKEASL